MGLTMLVRVGVLLVGLLVGAGVYSYGMFHTLRPTRSDFSRVANCAQSTAGRTEGPHVVQDSDYTLCYIGPGKWIKSPYGNTPFFFAIAIAFGSALVALTRSPFLNWAIRSSLRFVALSALLWGTPMALLGLQENYVEGTLTPDWAIHIVIYSELIAAVFGVTVWYSALRPFLLRRSGKP